ncbi:hypothetical protein POVWA2_003990 [Plasmodium ovale wallikeri]|uniref:Uncharacterized protein n=1 Tax=Plasmodium ovale wallikeri TaxID=864142 RepID=A0A1A8YIP8_PLAOA|nr:hypothetical protein POVWA1_003840 [Plasmodium ovale wallikeri]SBT31403.1 hypothetical protein POVWA2_003990 [Plasmodium ovale wallikeri]
MTRVRHIIRQLRQSRHSMSRVFVVIRKRDTIAMIFSSVKRDHVCKKTAQSVYTHKCSSPNEEVNYLFIKTPSGSSYGCALG